MLTAALRWTRLRLQSGGPLRRTLQALGLIAVGRQLYQAAILRRQIHEATLLGHRLRFSATSPREITRIDSTFTEAQFLTRILDAVQPDDVFYDVGANIGVVSLLVAAHGRDRNVTVHAFEPEPRNFRELERNVQLNTFTDRIHTHELGLGDARQRVTLHVAGETGDGRHSIVDREDADQTTGVEIDIEPMSEFVARGHAAPTIVKIDVEGAEYHVLLGMEPLLRDAAVRDLFIEVHPHTIEKLDHTEQDLVNLLERHNYAPVWSTERSREFHQHYRHRPTSA